MSIGKLLIDDQPHQVLPALAKAIGLNEAIFLQQVHYLLNHSRKNAEGKYWIFNTLEQWQEVFSYWSVSTIRRTIDNLKKQGLLIATDKFNKLKMDKTKWYSVDYERLENINMPTAKNDTPSVQNEQIECSNWTTPSVQNEQMTFVQNEQTNNHKNKNTTQDKNIYIKKSENSAISLLAEFGITDQLAKDFLTHRKAKNAPITKTALERLQKQADLARLPLAEVAEIMIDEGWRGFKAEWLENKQAPQANKQARSGKDLSAFSDDDDSWWRGQVIEVRGY